MANSFAAGLAGGAAVRASGRKRKADEAEAEKAKAKKVADSIEASRTNSLETVKQMTDLAVKIAGAGGDREDPNFEKLMESAKAAAMGHASVLNEFRTTAQSMGFPEDAIAGIEDPTAFVENAVLGMNAAVDAAFAGRTTQLSPEEVTAAGFPEDAVVQKESGGKLAVVFKPGAEDDPSKLEMLQASNLGKPLGELTEDEMANAIAGGRLQIIYDATTRVAVVTDLAGKPVAEPVPVAGPDDPGIVPATADPTEATGVAGAGRAIINTIGDAFGMGVAWPDAQAATVAMKGLSTRTMLMLTAEMPGRPSNLIREEIKALTPKPNSILEGSSLVTEKLTQIKALIDTEVDRLDRSLAVGVSPTDQGTMTASSEQLKELSADYGTLLQKFKDNDAGGDRAAGVAASQAALDAGDLEKARAINDALESGDAEALKKAMGDGGE